MAKVIFELKEVSYSYAQKIPALCAVDLVIEEGSKVALIGANGTGKSTLLAMLDALIFPDKGRIKAFGRELKESVLEDPEFSHSFRSRVGLLFQNPDVQLFCPTVGEDIAFGPLQLGVSQAEVKKRLDRVSADLRITHLLERPGHQLSIGEKRKVAIASVLAVDPDVLLLDEPTAGLDPKTSRDIIDIILAANERGKTIVTATHDLHIVEEISDLVHVFGEEKKIIRSGAHAEILTDEEFLRANNLIHIHRHSHKGQEHTHSHLHLHHQALGENVDKP